MPFPFATVDVNAFDAAVLRLLNCELSFPVIDTVLRVVQDKLIAVPAFIAVLLLSAFLDRRRCLRAFVAAAGAWGLCMLIATILWGTIERPRPTTAYGEARMLRTEAEISTCGARPDMLVVRGYPPRSPGFPSRHALSSGVFAMVLTLGWRWLGALAWLPALLVAVARVHKGVHWPTDVIAGLVIGALVTWGVWRLVPRVFGRVGLRALVESPEAPTEPERPPASGSTPDSDPPSAGDAAVG